MMIAEGLAKLAALWPSVKLNTASPRLMLPSWSWKVALIVWPLAPLAVKENGRETEGPWTDQCPVSLWVGSAW